MLFQNLKLIELFHECEKWNLILYPLLKNTLSIFEDVFSYNRYSKWSKSMKPEWLNYFLVLLEGWRILYGLYLALFSNLFDYHLAKFYYSQRQSIPSFHEACRLK